MYKQYGIHLNDLTLRYTAGRKTKKQTTLAQFSEISFCFWGLKQWCLHGSLTKGGGGGGGGLGGGGSWGSTTCGSNQGQELPLCQAALLLTQQSASRWHAGDAKQTLRFYEIPHHRAKDQKPVIKRNQRLLVVTFKKDKRKRSRLAEGGVWEAMMKDPEFVLFLYYATAQCGHSL